MHEFGRGSKGLSAAAIAVIGAACALTVMFTAAAAGDSQSDGKAGIILHVDDDAPPGGNGLSWKSPLRYLQDALAIANTPGSGISEIRIGQGVYKPDEGGNQTPGDVNASFALVNGVALRGGYAGFAEPDPDQRDFKKFITRLDGDLLGNDGPQWTPPGSHADNSKVVIRASNLDELTTLEGVLVRGGNGGTPAPGIPGGNSAGGALQAVASRIALLDCTFTESWSHRGGGVAVVAAHDLFVERCTFS